MDIKHANFLHHGESPVILLTCHIKSFKNNIWVFKELLEFELKAVCVDFSERKGKWIFRISGLYLDTWVTQRPQAPPHQGRTQGICACSEVGAQCPRPSQSPSLPAALPVHLVPSPRELCCGAAGSRPEETTGAPAERQHGAVREQGRGSMGLRVARADDGKGVSEAGIIGWRRCQGVRKEGRSWWFMGWISRAWTERYNVRKAGDLES